MQRRLPDWLTIQSGDGKAIAETRRCIQEFSLHTVCEEAKCPNIQRCFEKKRATFLLLGNFCTRSCGFCNIGHAEHPEEPKKSEPETVAQACEALHLEHIVLTMVTRDDLPDGGALHVAKTIAAVKKRLPQATVEVLVSDFQGNENALKVVLEAGPDILGHNLETVQRLTPRIRSKATFERSISVLKTIKQIKPKQVIKSGIMVGFGESLQEVLETLLVLSQIPVDIVTVGQYLQPSPKHLQVARWVPPEEFQEYEKEGKRLGIKKIASGPFVRSSFVD
jgi:lipoic acid synthetase